MVTETVRTIDDILKFTASLNKKHGMRLWYRGEENASLTLIPSIQRSERRIDTERFLTNDFYTRAKQIMVYPPEKENYSAWVSLMQHYGLPTRMLDWSLSPLVATFFATETYKSCPNSDAGIWILVPDLLNEQEGFGHCIYPIDAQTCQEMLLPAFKHQHHNPELVDRILACQSTERDQRMYYQQACFTIHNSHKHLESICSEDMLYKMIIPAEQKPYFLESLRVLGITESFIYPDLDHISKELRHFYRV